MWNQLHHIVVISCRKLKKKKQKAGVNSDVTTFMESFLKTGMLVQELKMKRNTDSMVITQT
jgi:acetylglutamate synthase